MRFILAIVSASLILLSGAVNWFFSRTGVPAEPKEASSSAEGDLQSTVIGIQTDLNALRAESNTKDRWMVQSAVLEISTLG
jgi:hypothetical protein